MSTARIFARDAASIRGQMEILMTVIGIMENNPAVGDTTTLSTMYTKAIGQTDVKMGGGSCLSRLRGKYSSRSGKMAM